MSLDLIIMALGGGTAVLPPTIFIERSDGGTPAEFILDSDGGLNQRTSSTLTNLGQWVSPASAASLYEVRSTVTSGSFSADPSAGSWVSLGSDRLWSRGAGASASQTVQATIEIRNASTLVVVTTSSLTLTCDRT